MNDKTIKELAVQHVKIGNTKIAQYLSIALKQRSRALENFRKQYGDDSLVVTECAKEIEDLASYIRSLRAN